MRVVKAFLDDQKEQQWLNEMAEKGWHFKKFSFPFYIFEQGKPGEYVYRTEILKNFGFGQGVKDYLDFVQEAGIEVVQKRLTWVCFRQHKSEGEFELYSDVASKLAYINRVYAIFLIIAAINLAVALGNSIFMGLNGGTQITSFIAGFNTGAFAVLLFPITKSFIRKRNIKKELELFEQ